MSYNVWMYVIYTHIYIYIYIYIYMYKEREGGNNGRKIYI